MDPYLQGAALPSKISQLRSLASQGDSIAMQHLLSQTLAHKQINVQVRYEHQRLEILLSAATLPNAQICLKLLSRELLRWQLPSEQALLIAARQNYLDAPLGWEQALTPSDLQTLAWGGSSASNPSSTLATEPQSHPQNLDQDVTIELRPQPFERHTWQALGAGSCLAGILMAVEQPKFILSYFIILVHELGHTALSWLFGFPAIPAFDFLHGGGVTLSLGERYFVIIWSCYTALGLLLYRYRRNQLTVQVLVTLGLVYSWLTFSNAHQLLITAMGHGFELIFAGMFLYRGLSGFACRSSIERPLYVMLGMFTIFKDLGFAWGLLFDRELRDIYLQGKGGVIDNDLVRIAQEYLHLHLNLVLWTFLFLTLATPVLSLLLYRYRLWMLYGFARLFLVLKV